MVERAKKQKQNPVDKSRGWAALRLVLVGKSQHEVAAETGVFQSTVSKLVGLLALASRRDALALWRAYAIEVAWWDEPPTQSQLRALKALEAA